MNNLTPSTETETVKAPDKKRLLRAFNISLAFVLMLLIIYTLQPHLNIRGLSVSPHDLHGLWGILTAPLLHGSPEHIASNSVALIILGTLAGTVYPRSALCGLPFMWLGSGLGAWFLGDQGSYHLGASGVTHGLMFLLFIQGILRRDRMAIATSMIAFLFYGSMLLTILPHEAGISWQSHLGGAIGGIISALLFNKLDPMMPKKRYSWEIEEENEALLSEQLQQEYDQFENKLPHDFPVLRKELPQESQEESLENNVIPFRPRNKE